MKNQATVEFMILFTLLILGVAIAAVISFQKVEEVNSQQLRIDAGRTLQSVTSSLDTAFIQGDGFITKVYLPETVGSRAYNITLLPNELTFTVGEESFSHVTIVRNTIGTLQKGENTLQNAGGVIRIL